MISRGILQSSVEKLIAEPLIPTNGARQQGANHVKDTIYKLTSTQFRTKMLLMFICIRSTNTLRPLLMRSFV
jgi:hypothetical protein